MFYISYRDYLKLFIYRKSYLLIVNKPRLLKIIESIYKRKKEPNFK